LNSTEIFTIALGLKYSWEITDIKITDNEGRIKELHLETGFIRGSKFKDGQNQLCPVHDTANQTLPFLGKHTA
jgi:hypothetical protein